MYLEYALDIRSEKNPVVELRKPFSFAVSSEELLWIKRQLMFGHHVVVEPLEQPNSSGYLTQLFEKDTWSRGEMLAVAFEDSGLGMHEHSALFVNSIGSSNVYTRLMDETLAAGFSVFLLAESHGGGQVAGLYTLRAAVSDNM